MSQIKQIKQISIQTPQISISQLFNKLQQTKSIDVFLSHFKYTEINPNNSKNNQSILSQSKNLFRSLTSRIQSLSMKYLQNENQSNRCLCVSHDLVTCLTCSRGTIHYCKNCFNQRNHKDHVVRQINRIGICHCGMHYKGDLQCCEKHKGQKLDEIQKREIVKNDQLEIYIHEFLRYCENQIFNNTISIETIKQLSKILSIGFVFDFLGKIFFQNHGNPFWKIINGETHLKREIVNCLMYYIYLPLSFHSLSSEFVYLLSTKPKTFHPILYEYYSSYPFELKNILEIHNSTHTSSNSVLDVKFNELLIVIDSLSIVLHLNIYVFPFHISHQMTTNRTTQLLSEITSNIKNYMMYSSQIILLLHQLIKVFDFGESLKNEEFVNYINYFKTIFSELSADSMEQFINEIQTIPDSLTNLFISQIIKNNRKHLFSKVIQNFKSLYTFCFPSQDIIIPSFSSNIPADYVDPFDIIYTMIPDHLQIHIDNLNQLKKVNNGNYQSNETDQISIKNKSKQISTVLKQMQHNHRTSFFEEEKKEITFESQIEEIILYCEFHNFYQTIISTTNKSILDEITSQMFRKNEFIIITWFLNYEETLFDVYINELSTFINVINKNKSQLTQLQLKEMITKYPSQPYPCNPFHPFFPSCSLPLSLFIRKMLKLPMNRSFHIAQSFPLHQAQIQLLKDENLTLKMTQTNHYHFIMNILWKRIDYKIVIKNDKYIEKLIIHLFKWIHLNELFKEDVMLMLFEYEEVTNGTQKFMQLNKHLL